MRFWHFSFLTIAALAGCDPSTSVVNSESPSPVTESLTPDKMLSVGKLQGAFRSAGDGAPAVLIVPGSGPTDRDGNNPMGVKSSTYRLLADGLQMVGVSTLRIDKRGMGGSADAGDPNAVSVEIYAQDYLDWAGRLREETGKDCVYLLGHSEGGVMVSAAAAQNSEGICGLILVAAPGRPMGDVLREQLRANPANFPILKSAISAIEDLEAGQSVDVTDMHPALQGLFAPQVQGFLISVMAIDPTKLVRRADVPTLVLQGDRDIQVSVEDAERLQAAGGELVILPGVNHVLKAAPKGRRGNLKTYSDPDLPLADGVVPAIAEFIDGN